MPLIKSWQKLIVFHVLSNEDWKKSKKNHGLRNPFCTCVTRWVSAEPIGYLRNPMGTCRTLEWRHVDHILLNLKKAKKAIPGFEPGYLRMMIRDGIHSATQYTNLHIITSNAYNNQDLKDASKINVTLRCLWRSWKKPSIVLPIGW